MAADEPLRGVGPPAEGNRVTAHDADRTDAHPTRPSWRRAILFGLLAALLAVLAFLPLLDALFTGNADVVTGIALLIYYALGVVIGYFSPIWWTAALLAWPCVLFSVSNLAAARSDAGAQRGLPVALVVLVVPLALALGGAYLGKILAARRSTTGLTRDRLS